MAMKQLLKSEFCLLRPLSLYSSNITLKFIELNNWKHLKNTSCDRKFYHVSASDYQVRKAAEKQVTTSKAKGQVSFPKKVAQAGKDATYLGVIVGGVAVTGFIFYMIGSELFSRQSPSVVFGKALKQCQRHHEVQDELGDTIKGRGEMNSRGRSRHVSHAEYEKDGVKYMRMKFYLKGSIRNGTAHLEVKQNESGKYEVRYLFVEVDKYPYKTIVVEDNR